MNYPQQMNPPRGKPQSIKNWLLDLVFPIRCINCGQFGRYLCQKCLNQIPLKQGFECIGCKQPVSAGLTCFFCRKENHLDRLLVAADYKNTLVKKTTKAFKFKFIAELSIPLSALLKKYIRQLQKKNRFNIFADNPVLIPVPIHKQRENWRGFNQSELLAKSLADIFQMESAPDVLARTKNTIPQADIEEREKRMENIKSAFNCLVPSKISGRTALLVDDICTTGATLNECAKVLKNNGAKSVIALVLAR